MVQLWRLSIRPLLWSDEKSASSTLPLHVISLFLEGKRGLWSQAEEAGRGELISQSLFAPLFKASFGKNPQYFLPKAAKVQQQLGTLRSTSPPWAAPSRRLARPPRRLAPPTSRRLMGPSFPHSLVGLRLPRGVTGLRLRCCAGQEGGQTRSRKCSRAPGTHASKGPSLSPNPELDRLPQ